MLIKGGELSMPTPEKDLPTSNMDPRPDVDASGVSRRKFLGGLGGAAAAAMASGVLGAAALEPAAPGAAGPPALDPAGQAAPAGLASGAHPPSSPANLRRKACWGVRKNMADYWFD